MDTMSLPTLQTPACTPSCTCARVWSLVGMYAVSAAVGAVAGGGVAAFNGWGAESDPVRAAGLAGAAVLATSLLVLGVFRAMNFGMIATKAAREAGYAWRGESGPQLIQNRFLRAAMKSERECRAVGLNTRPATRQ